MIDSNWLIDFVQGAAFLGAGGGGDPYVGRLMLQQELSQSRTVDLTSLNDIPDDALVIPIATMGAPTVMTERIPSTEATIAAVRKTEEILSQKAAFIAPIEAGGINATLPLTVGASMNLPVVDCDGMGRAFPELQMVTFGIYGVSASPVVLADEENNIVVVHGDNNMKAEALARQVCTAMGAMAQIALYPMNGRQLKDTAVQGTIELARRIGATIRHACNEHLDPFAEIIHFFAQDHIARCARVLFDGKVSQLRRETRGGFAVGTVEVSGQGESDISCVIDFQNEFLCLRKGGRVAAMVPDIISILDRETANPITTDRLKYGQRVKVMGLSVPPIMRTGEALSTFGPRVFGLNEDYVPLEDLDP